MADETRVDALKRDEFGKGSARRTRKEGRIPAVLYGHGIDPVHLALAGHDTMMALRRGGLNTLLTIKIDGKDQLALPKDVQVHPLKREIQHIDLQVVRKGEKVTVDVPVNLTGEVVPGGQVNHDLTTASVEAEATAIPEELVVDIEGLEIGAQVLAGELSLPAGSTLLTDPETMVVAISEVVEADLETDAVAEDEEAEGEEGEGAEGEEGEEGESEGGESSEGGDDSSE